MGESMNIDVQKRKLYTVAKPNMIFFFLGCIVGSLNSYHVTEFLGLLSPFSCLVATRNHTDGDIGLVTMGVI